MSGKRQADDRAWFEREAEGSEFQDSRLRKRFAMLLQRLWSGMGQTIPFACQDWASTKAAYRFFVNDRVSEQDILSGHFQASAARFSAADGPMLVLQDTTVFSYQRERPELIGYTGTSMTPRGRNGQTRAITQCGILMHSSLLVTGEGLPLGLLAVKFWTRSKFKGCMALKRHVNPTRVPIEEKESYRWLENMHQSSSLLGVACPLRSHWRSRKRYLRTVLHRARSGYPFLVRTCVDRLAGDGQHTIAHEMDGVMVKGLHRVELRDARGRSFTARLELRYKRMIVLPPIGKQNNYPALQLTVIHVQERDAPPRREPIEWKLITDQRSDRVSRQLRNSTGTPCAGRSRHSIRS